MRDNIGRPTEDRLTPTRDAGERRLTDRELDAVNGGKGKGGCYGAGCGYGYGSGGWGYGGGFYGGWGYGGFGWY